MLKVVGARRERGTGRFSNFFVFCSVKTGGRRKMNNVVQNDTVLIFLFFFIYIYETTSFWVKRAVSFKWLNFKSVPQIGPRPSCWPPFSLWSLASDLCNCAPNWSINFQFLQLNPWNKSKQPPLSLRLLQIGPWFRIFTIKSLIGP